MLCISRGDQLLEVDSVSLRHAALSEAYAILSECGPGPVSLIISRHPNPKVRAKHRHYGISFSLKNYSIYKLSSDYQVCKATLINSLVQRVQNF